MSRNFSFKTFFRIVSATLLQKYFEPNHLLTDFDWSLENDMLADALNAEIEKLSDNHAAIIEQDFATISDLANEESILGMIEIAHSLYDNADPIIDRMIQQSGFLNQVLWISLEQPDVYTWAVRMERMEKMTFKEDCLVGKGLHCSTDEESVEKLKERIQKFFKRQRRGRNCQIDVYVRQNPIRYCFFAYPEDYPKRDLTYRSSRLVSDVRRPVLEIVFVYEPENGNLKVHASRMRKVEVMQAAFCKAILGLPGIPDGSTRVYDLTNLLDPAFRFPTDPKDQVDEVSLRMLKTALDKNRNRKITCEGNPKNGGAELVRNMMMEAIAACGGKDRFAGVLAAKITMKSKAIDGGRKKSVTFILTVPSGSTLEDKPHHHIVRKYLEKWGLVRALLPDTE
ncbi:MAG TPA: hypothetical protein PLW42_12465, partial [Anaerohalosphaeraceae bacterium]|nr:hypothetical protein [Anaerohalosphaeraceae bacterium]